MGRLARQYYPSAFERVGAELPDQPAFSHLFAGLAQLADWLGSDTRPGFFPYTEPGEVRIETAALGAARALRAIGLDVDASRRALTASPPDFARAFGVPAPRPMQSALAEDGLGQVVVLESETGSGKTEAALWRFLHLWQRGDVDGLYFALPTRVAATQLHERIESFVQRSWPAGTAPVVVRALPGYEAADGATFQKLPDFQVLWSDHPGDDVAERRWAAESPKRYLAATIAVGTIDQVLLGALKVKHAHLRQAMLARILLVVDEVHASDAYMATLLEQVLRAHVACGGHALLLSATLGSRVRSRFLAIANGDARPRFLSVAGACAIPYPAIGSGHGVHAVEGNARQKTVHWKTIDTIDDPHSIAMLAVVAAMAGARVLVVRNTVPAAIAALEAIEQLCAERGCDLLFRVHSISTLHHSRFSRQDRPLLDRAVQAQMGKLRSGAGGRIIVGTQTLEQSLDIDADLLVTDLCPMDVLLQRLGRLHRHERPDAAHPDDLRPPGFDAPRAWILCPAQGDLAPLLRRARHGLGPIRAAGEGLQGVYVDVRSLEATRRLVDEQPSRTIPDDNRLLVERATHAEVLDAIAHERGDEWIRFGLEYEGSLGARASVARLHALPYDEIYDTLTFPDGEGRIGSRLGAADRIVTFEPAIPGPFGIAVQQLAIRHHQLPRDGAPDAVPERIEPLAEGGFEFALGTARYRYGRKGLVRLKEDSSHAQS